MMMTKTRAEKISSIKNYLDQRSKCKIIYTIKITYKKKKKKKNNKKHLADGNVLKLKKKKNLQKIILKTKYLVEQILSLWWLSLL